MARISTRPKPPGRIPFCFPHLLVRHRRRSVAPRRVRQVLDAVPVAGIRDPIEQHPAGAQAGDPHGPRRIQLASPLDAVHEQLPEGEARRLPDVEGKIRLELGQEALNPVDRLARARHEQLDPFRSRRQHLDRGRVVGGQGPADDVDQALGIERLRQEVVGVLAERAEHGVRRVEAGDDDDLRRAAVVRATRQHVEPAHSGKPHVEEDDAHLVAANDGQRLRTVRGGLDPESTEGEQLAQPLPRRVVVIHDQDVVVSHGR